MGVEGENGGQQEAWELQVAVRPADELTLKNVGSLQAAGEAVDAGADEAVDMMVDTSHLLALLQATGKPNMPWKRRRPARR